MGGERWNELEKLELMSNYGEMSIVLLAKLLCRSRDAITGMARRLSLNKKIIICDICGEIIENAYQRQKRHKGACQKIYHRWIAKRGVTKKYLINKGWDKKTVEKYVNRKYGSCFLEGR